MKLRHQGGLTVTELMVALALGLLVMLAAGSMLVSANRSFSSQADAAAVDDAGRFALELIGRAARQTAFVNLDRDDAGELAASGPARIGGADARSLARDSAGIDGLKADAANGSDVLALRFAGSGPAPDGDGSVLSCAGFPVHAREDGWAIFYVARSAAGVAELRCKYRGNSSWSADAVVAGVDSFQVLYGLDTDTPPDGLANRFETATAINAMEAALVAAGETDAEREFDRRRRTPWKRIASIKVALLLHGRSRSPGEGKPREFDLFGAAYSAAAGKADKGSAIRESDLDAELSQRERRMFGTTILLRNPSS